MNKIIASVVLAIILIFGINKITDAIFYVKKPEKSAYQVAGLYKVTSSSSEKETASDGNANFSTLLASANIGEGEKVFKKCAACHSIAKGGKNKIGPALWGVLGRTAGTVEGYKYSKAMASYGKSWSIEEMNGFLTKPKDWMKGTKMSFAGLKNPKDRASVIVYMNQNTDNPLEIK